MCINYWDSLPNKKGQSECFNYFFQHIFEPQIFWNMQFESRVIVNRINFDEMMWRDFLYLDIDLSKHKRLKLKMDKKKKKIKDIKSKCKQSLEDILPMDIIKYCIYIYI